MLPSIYGSLGCLGGGKLVALPSCGKYVTDIMQSSCDGRLNCSFNVNYATFGTTNCGGGENLFVEYECCK